MSSFVMISASLVAPSDARTSPVLLASIVLQPLSERQIIFIIITIIIIIGSLIYSATLYKISVHFTSGSPRCGTCPFQYQFDSLGNIQPCCHNGTGDYSNTQAITIQPGTHIILLGQENAHTGEVPCPRIQRHTAIAETRIQDLSIQSRRAWPPRHDTLHVYEVLYSDNRNTEGGHC